ncbi:MAG: hypothetical protein ABFD90_01735 [Phycisphaerales bacterium]
MDRRTSITVLMTTLCLAATPTLAAPLQKSEIGPAANWVAHIDLEAFRSSGIGKLILAELQSQGVGEKLQSFETIFSFNPLRDIRDVTVYGNGQDRDNAVAVFEGQFDPQKLLAVVRLNPQYQEIPYKGATVHRWQQEPKPGDQAAGGQADNQMMYGSICDGNRVVIGSGLEAVKQAVDTMKGQATGTSAGLLNQIPQGHGAVFAVIAAAGVGDMVGQNPQAALLQQTDSLSLAIGESADKVFGELSLQAQSAEVAQNMTKLLEGIVAMAQLSGNERPRMAELAKGLNVSCADKTTQVRFEAATQSMFQFLKEQWEQQGQKQNQP